MHAEADSLEIHYPTPYRLLVGIAGLIFGPVFLVMGVGGAFFLGSEDPASSAILVLLVGGLGAFFLWGAIDSLRSRLTLGSDAITKRTWSGAVTSIAWPDVVSVRWSHWSGYVIRSRHGEVVTVQRLMATTPFMSALRNKVDASKTLDFPTPDLAPPTRSEPPKAVTWAMTAVVLIYFGAQLDWRYLDVPCLGYSAQKVFIRQRGGPDRPSLCLQWAAYENDVPWIQKLLARGANPNAADDRGSTALTFAANAGHIEAARALLAAGADPFLEGKYDDSPILIALSRDERAMVEDMVRARRDAIDTPRATALLVAARQENRREIEEFLRRELKQKLPAIADPEVEKRYQDKLARASAALDAGNPSASIGLSEDAIALDPITGQAYLMAAYGYLQLKQFGRAKERAKLATERLPQDGYSWQLLGSIYLEAGDYRESEQALTKAIDLNVPTMDRALADRAVVRMELGRSGDALVDARAACERKSELGCGLVRDLEARTAIQ